VSRGSQGLRRPRFSFFRFTCQTAWGRNPVPGHARGFAKQPLSVGTDRYSLLSVKASAARPRCRAAPRPVCRYIGRPLEQCQPGILSFFHRIVTGPTDGRFLREMSRLDGPQVPILGREAPPRRGLPVNREGGTIPLCAALPQRQAVTDAKQADRDSKAKPPPQFDRLPPPSTFETAEAGRQHAHIRNSRGAPAPGMIGPRRSVRRSRHRPHLQQPPHWADPDAEPGIQICQLNVRTGSLPTKITKS
jgi:hypothetical protein